MKRVAVLGLGYVGLPLAVRAVEAGHEVVGVDVDPVKVSALLAGSTYIEDVSDARLQDALATGRFKPSDRLASSTGFFAYDVGIITVPTPLRSEPGGGRVPDLSYVQAASRMLGRALRPGAVVVLESTTYPGTTEGLLADVLREESGLVPGEQFHLGFSPERIDPGSKTHTLENTPKVVSGTTPAGLAAIQDFYDTIVEQTVPVSSPRVAELTKLFENIQAYVNIALINEVATLCRDLDIDVWEMIDASMTKGHSVARWKPGPGVGGHCLPIDPMYLAWQARTKLGRPFRFAELAHAINGDRPEYVAERVAETLGSRGIHLSGSKVLLLGVAYKPNVADVRESPAFPLVQALHRRGVHVTVADPHVTGWLLTRQLPLEDLGGKLETFDLAVVVTAHDSFDYDKVAREARLVLDCRNAMAPAGNVVAL
jgi:UDP-N-acetyl-D-mannosaminuronic acid dehydrogenase/UDP-N-acetyl-D-glucosamine dehydrogenase